MQKISAKYNSRNDWVRKVIHLELCKKFKYDHTNKWYIHDQESVLENETHTFFGSGVEIQMDHRI